MTRDCCTQNTDRVKAFVLIKILVLTRNQGIHNVLIDIVQWDNVTVLGLAAAVKNLAVFGTNNDTSVVAVHQPLYIGNITRKVSIG